LMALLEERKRKLGAEGLFDDDRKKKLPFLPRVVGIITSPTGAVIRDMMHGFNERFPAHVVVWPVRVQGETCAAEVAAAIRGFNALRPGGTIPRPDVLIVARGGGSLEDLWGFNEEIVVRAAAESEIPLISAVGHETDWTLLDLAADARAPTPTKAAEWAVPKYSELLEQLSKFGDRLHIGVRRGLEGHRSALLAAQRGLPKLQDLVALPRQRFDSAAQRLGRGLQATTQVHAQRLSRLAPRLQARLLAVRIERSRQHLDKLTQRGGGALGRIAGQRRTRAERAAARLSPSLLMNRIGRLRQTLDGNVKMLSALSYQSVLQRGFALVRDEQGRAVRAATGLAPGTRIGIEFADGGIAADVSADAPPAGLKSANASGDHPAWTRPVPVAKRPGGNVSGSGGSQGSLF
jgi:exodeoxyribonuclease VII large subunit